MPVDENKTCGNCPDCHATPCDELQDFKTLLQATSEDVKAIKEIIEAWNNARGFVKTIKTISSVVKWIAGVGIAVAAIIHFFGGK